MTRFEKIKSAQSPSEMVKILSREGLNLLDCSECTFSDNKNTTCAHSGSESCDDGHEKWLNKEVKNDC